MDNTREKLIELLSKTSCRGDGESLGSCPDRKYGMCGEVANLSYCVIQNIANHLICNGVTLQDHDCCWATEVAYKNGYEAGKKDALNGVGISNLETATKWIPATERLPKEWVDVLVWSKYGFCVVAVSLGSHGKWRESWTHMMIDDDTVTHWMPLPEPPKGE